MSHTSLEQRAQVIRCLVDGTSVRATARITNVSKPTILKILVEVGERCAAYQDEHNRGLTCKRLQADEVWSFVYSKDKNVPEQYKGVFGYGDVWLWTAMCADCKLIPCWYLSTRDADAANHIMQDVKSRLTGRVQLTTDGLHCYVNAVDNAFGDDVDYAQLVKMYGTDPMGQRRYSPSICLSAESHIVRGNPDREHINTSYIERSNLTIRMGNRRYTRLTNAFSKKVENHAHHLALHFMYYNYARQHQTLRVSPAMQAGIENHLWSVEEIAAL